jgi:hypothetical protein
MTMLHTKFKLCFNSKFLRTGLREFAEDDDDGDDHYDDGGNDNPGDDSDDDHNVLEREELPDFDPSSPESAGKNII